MRPCESTSPIGERRATLAVERDPRNFLIPALMVALALAIAGSLTPAARGNL